MNKKNLIIISHNLFVESYFNDSVIPSKVKSLDIVTNKKNSNLNKLIKNSKIKCNVHVVKRLTGKWFKKKI